MESVLKETSGVLTIKHCHVRLSPLQCFHQRPDHFVTGFKLAKLMMNPDYPWMLVGQDRGIGWQSQLWKGFADFRPEGYTNTM